MGAIIHFFQVPLYRELSVAALILLLIIVYYFRYVHFAKLSDTRLHRRWLDNLIRGTRRVMIVMVLALVALVVYDRVIMPRAASSAAPVTSARSSSKAAQKSTKKQSAAKVSSSTKKAKSSSSSATSGEIIDATEHRLSTQQYHDLQVVENYFKKNPSDPNATAVFRYRGQATGNAGLKVSEIGGYKELSKNRLKLIHVYWVYPSGQFDVHQ